MHPEAQKLIQRLSLAPHPEGGFYREVFRSEQQLALLRGERAALTAIHFVLPAGHVSHFHRVRSDEVWSFQDGDGFELHVITPDGAHKTLRLGRRAERGEQPLVAVPAGSWQAALGLGEVCSWASCLVAPGFDFADFELGDGPSLARTYPRFTELFRRFAR